MQQLRYAWEDIKSQKARSFILFIQVTAALLLFSFVISIALNVASYHDKLNRIIEEHEIYLTRDMTDPTRLNEILADPESSDRFHEYYTYIKNSPSFGSYTADAQHLIWLTDERLDSTFVVQSGSTSKGYNLLKIDENFVNIFEPNCIEGSLFTKKDYQVSDDMIPLLLGYDFRSVYNLNDVIIDTRGFQYKVIGFLEKSTYFLQPGKSGEIYTLDKWFIMPVVPELDDAYLSAIDSTYFITGDPVHLLEIQQKSTELGLLTYEFRSFSEQMQRIQEDYDLQIKMIGLMLLIILIFSIIGLISNLVQFINTHTKEFTIHLLCGGQIISIVQRILIQVFILIIIADIIVILIQRNNLAVIITIVFSFIMGVLIIVFPALKLSALGINNLLKRSE